MARTGGTQQLTGIYLVQPGGIINLKQYGVVHVAGKTLVEARLAIEKQLSQFFDSPQVAVNVAGYNSAEVLYRVRRHERRRRRHFAADHRKRDGLGRHQFCRRIETRLEPRIWISRPAPGDFGCEQILPIDYMAITRGGSSATNYQLMPGDRIFIAEDSEVAMNNYVMKVTAPVYQLLGIAQLGRGAVGAYQSMGRGFNQNRRGF